MTRAVWVGKYYFPMVRELSTQERQIVVIWTFRQIILTSFASSALVITPWPITPSFNYEPWAGVDEDDLAYTDKTLTTALDNPFDNDDIDNLESHFYTIWSDDGDGVYESGECPDDFDAIDTSDGGTISEAECEAAAGCVSVDDLSAAQQTNYANWYTYYRERIFVTKKALSELIVRSTERMGLATINQNTTDDDDDFAGFSYR